MLSATDPESAVMSDAARWFMDYRNADGSLAEMCGNGIRVFGRFLVDSWFELAGELRIATRAGVKTTNVDPIGDVMVNSARQSCRTFLAPRSTSDHAPGR